MKHMFKKIKIPRYKLSCNKYYNRITLYFCPYPHLLLLYSGCHHSDCFGEAQNLGTSTINGRKTPSPSVANSFLGSMTHLMTSTHHHRTSSTWTECSCSSGAQSWLPWSRDTSAPAAALVTCGAQDHVQVVWSLFFAAAVLLYFKH